MQNEIPQSKKLSPALGLGFGILAASTASIFIRFAQEQAPSITIAALRLLFATILLAPVALLHRREEIRHINHKKFFMLLASGILLALHFASWISSLEYTSVASSVVLVTTSPLWVALISPFLLNESLKKQARIGLAIALAGSVVVGLGQSCYLANGMLVCEQSSQILSGRPLWGNFLALVGAWCAAGYLIIGRQLRSSVSLVSYAFMVYGIAALALLGLVAVSGQTISSYSPDLYVWCLLLAIFPQILGHTSFNWALKYISANFVSLALLGEPVASVILAVIFLKETPAILEIVGGITILAGIYFASRSD